MILSGPADLRYTTITNGELSVMTHLALTLHGSVSYLHISKVLLSGVTLLQVDQNAQRSSLTSSLTYFEYLSLCIVKVY